MSKAEDVTALALVEPKGALQAITFESQPRRPIWEGVRRALPFGLAGSACVLAGAMLGPAGVLGGVTVGCGLWVYGLVVGTNDPTGARRVLKARVALASDDPERARQGTARLEAIASDQRVSEPYRMEAAGHLAAARLDRGDLDGAISILEKARDAEAGRGIADRALERGLLGELMRSILGWLNPVDDGPVIAHSTAFELDDAKLRELSRPADLLEFRARVAALGVLEASDGGREDEVLAALAHARRVKLPDVSSTLWWLCLAMAGRVLPTAKQEFEHDAPANVANLVANLLPQASVAVYRQPAQDVEDAQRNERALVAMEPPASIQRALERKPHTGVVRAMELQLATRGLVGSAFGGGFVLCLAAVVFGEAAFMLGSLALVPLVVASTIRGARLGRRRARVAALRDLGSMLPYPWLREFEYAPGLLDPTDTYGADHERILALYVGCAKAESLLGQGRRHEAWTQVAWWFRGFSEQRTPLAPLAPVAASLVRVATLTQAPDLARRLVDAFEARGVDGGWGRTAYGNAPRALALASALRSARAGEWQQATDYLSKVQRTREVWMLPRDAVLAQALFEIAETRGAKLRYSKVSQRVWTEHAGWVYSLCPELLGDHEGL